MMNFFNFYLTRNILVKYQTTLQFVHIPFEISVYLLDGDEFRNEMDL